MPGRDAASVLIDALRDPALYGSGVARVRLVETHISWVLLTGERAYKIKKPVRLPFLDFTTLADRRHYCEEELRLNRRLAPELYLGVVPIGGSPTAPQLGKEPAIEYAVEMREFPSEMRLDRCIARDEIGAEDITAFAETIGRFHTALSATPPDARYGSAEAVLAVVEHNLEEAADAIGAGFDEGGTLRGYLTGSRWRDALERRKLGRSIREGHGDLHLENLAYWDRRIIAFDALEFDPALRWIDVIDETAFVTMDLIAHGRRELAFCLLNRYLEITGDYAALELLRFYMVHRALVRAKVRAIKAAQTPDEPVDSHRAYLEVARDLLPRRNGRLLITHGLSGSGKTTVTQQLVERLPAIRVRSDIERKRRAGLHERARSDSALGTGLYTESSTESTYAALAGHAATGLAAGLDIIVDATFLHRAERQRFDAVAARAGAQLVILDFRASDGILRERLAERQRRARDASEATIEVLEHQLTHREDLTPAEREHALTIDTEEPVQMESLVKRIRTS